MCLLLLTCMSFYCDCLTFPRISISNACITRILIVVITEFCISNPIHSVKNRFNTSHIFTVTCLKSQTCSPFGGFCNRSNFGQPKDVLLRQLIVRWKDRAIDILLIEKTTCFNIGNGHRLKGTLYKILMFFVLELLPQHNHGLGYNIILIYLHHHSIIYF